MRLHFKLEVCQTLPVVLQACLPRSAKTGILRANQDDEHPGASHFYLLLAYHCWVVAFAKISIFFLAIAMSVVHQALYEHNTDFHASLRSSSISKGRSVLFHSSSA